MRRKWLEFFLLLLPAALLGSALVCEALAFALRGIQPFQSSLDNIVAAVESEKPDAKWLIFGDSTTEHVLMHYTLGPPDLIANLTTHAGAGMPSMDLLLRRYLATHSPPKAIILALSPEMYVDIPDEKTADFWLIPVFRKPAEQVWLSQFYQAARVGGWRPAATDIKFSIFDPATGLFAPKRDHLSMGPATPSSDMPKEAPITPSVLNVASETERSKRRLELGSRPSTILIDICRMARDKGFEVHLLTAPLPIKVRQVWESRGDLTRLDNQVNALMKERCGHFSQFDMSAVVTPPNFDDEGLHILGDGWENQYALALKNYIESSSTRVGAFAETAGSQH